MSGPTFLTELYLKMILVIIRACIRHAGRNLIKEALVLHSGCPWLTETPMHCYGQVALAAIAEAALVAELLGLFWHMFDHWLI